VGVGLWLRGVARDVADERHHLLGCGWVGERAGVWM
jgi:hypothetical protein